MLLYYRGKLVGNAVPRLAECPDAPSMDHAIDAAPVSEMQHLSLAYDATPFGVLPFSSEDHQDLHTPVSSVRASNLAEDASFRADLGSDWGPDSANLPAIPCYEVEVTRPLREMAKLYSATILSSVVVKTRPSETKTKTKTRPFETKTKTKIRPSETKTSPPRPRPRSSETKTKTKTRPSETD
ncbi:hypothetical protein GWK47_027699 [Chionoecetes opilio]|uniref:Uncharacterized protein n=1 Tax=Chionoecetes opilio TaxID=41210 RepID=A0A8J8W963_CHIOP|nr:hypothetical protein GWK47_027699 [Chionoecetes opilio]